MSKTFDKIFSEIDADRGPGLMKYLEKMVSIHEAKHGNTIDDPLDFSVPIEVIWLWGEFYVNGASTGVTAEWEELEGVHFKDFPVLYDGIWWTVKLEVKPYDKEMRPYAER